MAKEVKEKKPKKEEKKQEAAAEESSKGPTPRLKEKFRGEILPLLMKRDQYKNAMAVPRLQKIVVNMGVGEASRNIKVLDYAVDEIGRITGQKAVIRRAKKAISSFKLREGMPIGASVTLRGDRMYEFVDRLVSIALPRVRDFKGLNPDAFDGRGNYTLGLKDQLIFPEIDYTKVDKMRGMNITFVTSARSDEEARTLLAHLGLPFRK
jgi:large subunit ribosomal protein L5